MTNTARPSTLASMASPLTRLNRTPEAARCLRDAANRLKTLGDSDSAGHCLRNLAMLVAASGNNSEAARIAQETMVTLQGTTNEDAKVSAAVQFMQYFTESALEVPPQPDPTQQ